MFSNFWLGYVSEKFELKKTPKNAFIMVLQHATQTNADAFRHVSRHIIAVQIM